jgi:ankyrin repeat protein
MSSDLFEAIEAHDRDRLAQLLAGGADPNTTQDAAPGWRPLHAAIEELEDGGPVDALVVLLRAGAAVDERDSAADATPLLMACFREQREAVRILLAAGADPNATGGEGDTPLGWWAERGDREMAALVLDCGGTETVDAPSGLSGRTPLAHAASRLDLPMIELLLDRGASPEATGSDRRTARDCLPPRDDATAEAWDAAARALGGDDATPQRR